MCEVSIMLFLLNETRIRGIKSVCKTVSLSHTNKVIGPDDFQKCYIKAIYGNNGAGKSALVHAYSIYRAVVTREYPFKDTSFSSLLAKLINKATRECSVGVSFSISFPGGNILRFRHDVAISVDGGGAPYLRKESLDELNLRGDTKRHLFSLEDGVYTNGTMPKEFFEKLGCSFFRQNSVVSFARSKKRNEGYSFLRYVYAFASSLQVCFGSLEDDRGAFGLASFLAEEGLEEGDSWMTKNAPLSFQAADPNCLWAMPSEEEERYRALEPSLERFLKLAKPSLRGVSLLFKRDGVSSYCSPIFHYDGYSVDYEFESTGVKKLCQLFLALYSASKGSIVVIDEMDAGLHDVFFERLLEYFIGLSECQLVLTTHNINAMESLKRLRKSIDVLTDECEIVSWVSKGKSSPSLFYTRGALGGTPLNLHPFDFAGIFESEGRS